MTTSDHTKILNQLSKKPGKLAKYEKHNTKKRPEKGQNSKKCSLCGRTGGHISKYGLKICRQCFRDNALELGFKKYT